jgi:hypothetical protein
MTIVKALDGVRKITALLAKIRQELGQVDASTA